MFEVDDGTLIDYLRGPGNGLAAQLGLPADAWQQTSGQTLAWGVSNLVMRIETPGLSFVLKQSRKQLRTKIDWFSRLDRIWREVDVQRALLSFVPAGSVPQVLFEDRGNYLYGMEAVDADHRVWKAELLDGRADSTIARQLGDWLAIVHRASTNRADLREQLGDRVVFDELRLDPFYRYVAQHEAAFREPLERLIADTLARQDCLVLADFSPKNILLTTRGPVVVDFETGHYGDPGFDIGFFLSHLLLKTVRFADRVDEYLGLAREFWSSYVAGLNHEPDWLSSAGRSPSFDGQCVRHLAACMLARIDGKSRVDYLTQDWQAPLIRELCRDCLYDAYGSIVEVFEQLEQRLRG